MATEAEKLQAKEFLKRAEIRTMKKDLQALREADALKERDKIVKIKTLEEQIQEQEKKLANKEKAKNEAEKAGREKVLEKNAAEERMAEKDLKEYASEQERQQIFLLESQRLGFGKQAESIDKEKDPALKLQKNKILLEKRDWEAKLNSVLEQEKKLEDEQKFIAEKAQTTTLASERKSLEQRRWALEKEIQEIEKKRWEIEKQLENIENKIKEIDKSSEQLVAEKNDLNQKILGIDKSLRDIYSAVIAKVEERRRGEAEEQKAAREATAKIKAQTQEKIQRQQWTRTAEQPKENEFLKEIPAPVKEKLARAAEIEEEQRKKFIQDVEEGTKK